MPVKQRVSKERRPQFGQEVLDLFRAIEKVKPARRFEDKRTLELAKLLGLTSEYWSANFVNDVDGPCHPLDGGYIANVDWTTCRAVREQLLTGLGKKEPRKNGGA